MPDELAAVCEVAAVALDRLAISPAQSLHRAIARRAFGGVGPVGLPARIVHDATAASVYGLIRAGATCGARLGPALVRRFRPAPEAVAITGSARGRLAISAVNALIGDLLEERHSPLAIRMSIRHRAADVAPERAELSRIHPVATSRVAVFLHGLGEHEEHWFGRKIEGNTACHGSRLERELGYTAVYIRYNSGLPVRRNGELLTALLEELGKQWPVPLEELALIGHSMGGLVARAACSAARQAGHGWPSKLRSLITLGTPHLGAPLEKAVHAAAHLSRLVPEAYAFGRILEHRSQGIRDLRRGLAADAHPPAGCRHTFVSASLSRDPRHPLGLLLGDLLVRTESALGKHHRHPVRADATVHLGGLNHFDLLDHPAVYDVLRRALAAAGQGREGEEASPAAAGEAGSAA